MRYINFTTIVLVCFAAYILHTTYTIYTLFKPPQCKGGITKCIEPYFDDRKPLLKQKFTVSIFTSTSTASSTRNLKTMWRKDDFNVMETISIHVNVSIPKTTRRNGSLFVHIYLHPQGSQPFQNDLASYNTAPLTKYALNKGISFNLLSEKPERNASTSGPGSHDIPVTHWRPCLTFHVLTDPVSFSRYAIPSEVYSMLRLSPDGKYIPFVYIDELEMLDRNLKPIDANTTEMALNIAYSPIGIGKLRVWRNIHVSMDSMKNLGFKDKDLDEVKGIFTDTNLYLVGLTFTISIFHLMFDFLAFKSEITYWKKRSTTIGLSTRAVLWRCISTAIIFLYLLDEKTSLLVLIPTGIGVLIEIWKVTKAFKITLSWSGRFPSLQFGQKSNEEKKTEEFDTQAMKYLSYPLYPLLILGAIYSLLYQSHNSWYSWAIKSAVNGVYIFGFLFMLPQLFVNYKLKSVAHLPWRALMYKAFNTFIDDVFAFIITMPTAHRLACFRDDIVFVIYLYQRWLYPVDVKRVNEYGVSFDDTTKKQHKD